MFSHCRLPLLLACLCIGITSYGQTVGDTLPPRSQHRFPAWFTPSGTAHIHGLAFGPVGSVHLCSEQRPQVSNGLALEFLGTGIFPLIAWKAYGLGHLYPGLANDSALHALLVNTRPWKVTHNGILISTMGSSTSRVHGVVIGGLAGWHPQVRGVSVHGVRNIIIDQTGLAIAPVNHAVRVRGAQIGLFNRTHALCGLQIGLWNRNAKRALPLINWGFDRSLP